ncbi:hypothetical protein L4Z97_006034, partial [Pseudomonas aeruginosa]
EKGWNALDGSRLFVDPPNYELNLNFGENRFFEKYEGVTYLPNIAIRLFIFILNVNLRKYR